MELLATRDLSVRFPGVIALDALSLAVEPGVIGLIGANGAGKSTLIKVVLGLQQPSAGTVSLFGEEIRRHGAAVRRYVGYMPEHDCLPLDMTATEFVAHMARISGLPRSAARERTADTLRHVGLAEERYRRMSDYSTGMKQRVKLAQALVHDPRLLLLDEPTNGLDPAGREEMLDLLARIGRTFGISMLLSTHLLGEIERVCDSIILIDAGRLVEQGPVARFTAMTSILDVDVDGEPTALAERLRGQGFRVATHGQRLEIELRERPPYDAVRDGVVELGLGLLRMQQRRQTLESLFEQAEQAEQAEAAHA